MKKMSWRFVDLGEIDCFLGPAVFEAVMQAVSEDRVDDTILFWQPERPAVYVGFHQLVREDVDVEGCGKAGVPVIRRVLGGGAGYCDPNQVLYNIIYKEGSQRIPRGPRNAYRFILRGVVEALHGLGIRDACIDEERFGVYANGKKISGSGQLSSLGVVNSGGSFLVDFDYTAMGRFLKDPVKNLRKGVLRPEDGMTCLRKEVGNVTAGEAKAALRRGFEKVLGESYDAGLHDYETALARELRKKYLTDEWTFRADLRKDRVKK